MTTVTRPALRYHGGKWVLSKWIISHFPTHRVYTEAFGGAASVLLRKSRVPAEIYNDLDGEIVNLFRVLRDPAQARELVRLVKLTPYARAEFDASYLLDGDPVEQARRTMVRSFMGQGSTMTGRWRTGFRVTTHINRGTTPATDWLNLADALPALVDRMRGVIIENQPALEVLTRYDGPDCLHYVDPPYVLATRYVRWSGEAYRHELTDDDHRELAAVLHGLTGTVVLSGYPCPLYAELYADWQCVTRAAHTNGGKSATEVLWLKPGTMVRPQLAFEEAR